jgi:H+/Cl- antiporter ClcA
MSLTPPRAVERHQLGDDRVDRRMIMLAAMAIVVGTGGALGTCDAHVLGAGYASIEALLNASLPLKVVAALLMVKTVVWLVAL